MPPSEQQSGGVDRASAALARVIAIAIMLVAVYTAWGEVMSHAF